MTTTKTSSITQLIPLFKTKLNTCGLQNIHNNEILSCDATHNNQQNCKEHTVTWESQRTALKTYYSCTYY